MVDYINLVKNEWLKLFKKKSTIVLLAIIGIILIGCFSYFIFEKNLHETNNKRYNKNQQIEFEEQLRELIDDYSYILKTYGYPDYEKVNLMGKISMYQFVIDNNISWIYYSINENDFQIKPYRFHEKYFLNSAYKELGLEYDEKLETAVNALIKDNDCIAMYQYALEASLEDLKKGELPYKSLVGTPVLKAKQKEEIKEIIQNHYNYLINNQIPFMSKKHIFQEYNLMYQILSRYTGNQYEAEALIYEYLIDNEITIYVKNDIYYDLNHTNHSSFWSVFSTMRDIFMYGAGIITIISASSILTFENKKGKVKTVYLSPVKRWKLFLSKVTVIYSLPLLIAAISFFLFIILGVIFYGHEMLFAPLLTVEKFELTVSSPFAYSLMRIMLSYIQIIVMSTLAMAISCLTRLPAVSYVVSCGVYLFGYYFLRMSNVKNDIFRLALSSNLDIWKIHSKFYDKLFENHYVVFSVGIILLYFTIFFLTAWIGFVKRSNISRQIRTPCLHNNQIR